MTTATPLPVGHWADLEKIIDRFEEAWRSGARPAIEDHLPTAEPDRRAVLVELVHADLELRLESGEEVGVESYLDRYPELSDDPKAVVELIGSEYDLRGGEDSGISAQSYLNRFPQYRQDLESHFKDKTPIPGRRKAADNQTPLPQTIELDASAVLRPERRAGRRREITLDKVQVPGYQIIQELGRGGMGVVYEARDLRLGRLVALKMILAGAHAGPDELARFRTEAEAVARLQHPNIVQIHHIGEYDSRPYISLEFVSGGSLAQHMNGKPIAPRQAAELVETLARAVEHAHRQGILHRDLKPANVLLQDGPEVPSGGFGTPKLTDFGLAKKIDPGAQKTQTGAVVGTPSYMAPEQAGGKSVRVGAGADIYALGAILYEMLTGIPPIRGETPLDTMLLILSEEPVPPSQLQRSVPRDLETICLKCLEKDPARRYASAQALADDLHRYLDQLPIQARPTSSWERLVKWSKRRPAVAALIAVTILAFVAGLSASLMVAQSWANIAAGEKKLALAEKQGREEASAKEKLAEKNHAKAEEARAKAEANLYVHRIALADREWLANHVDRAEQLLLKSKITAPGMTDHRDWEWHYLRRLCRQASANYQAPGALSVAVAPRSSPFYQAASCPDERVVKVWDVKTGKVLLTLPDAGPVAAISPDGKYLASAELAMGEYGELLENTAAAVKVWELPSGKIVANLTGHKGPVLALAFHMNGNQLASGSMDGTIRIWTLEKAECISDWKAYAKTPADEAVWVESLSFGENGTRIASAGSDGRIKVWDVRSKEEVRIFQEVAEPGIRGRGMDPAKGGSLEINPFELPKERIPRDPSMRSSKGKDPSMKSSKGKSDEHEREKPQNRTTTAPQSGPFRGRSYPSSDKVAFGDKPSKIFNPDTGETVLTLRGQLHNLYSVAYSADGKVLAASRGNNVKVWSFDKSREGLTLRGHTDTVRSVAFDATGKYLVTASYDRSAKVWSLETGEEIATLRGHNAPVNSAAFISNTRVVSASWDGSVKVWDITRSGESTVFHHHQDYARGLSCSPSGSWASAGADMMVAVLDPTTGKVQTIPSGHKQNINALAFSPDSAKLASAGYDGTIRLLDMEQKKETAVWTGHEGLVYRVVFSPDGTRVASAGQDGTVRIWDVATGKQVLRIDGHSGRVFGVAYRPDGKVIASAGDDRIVRLWDPATGKQLQTLEGHENDISNLVFSQDGTQLATSSLDRTARIWDVVSGKLRWTLQGHAETVLAVAFTPDGKRLATCSNDRTVKLWNTASGQEVLALRTQGVEILNVAFDPDGNRLAASGVDGSIRIWDGTPVKEEPKVESSSYLGRGYK